MRAQSIILLICPALAVLPAAWSSDLAPPTVSGVACHSSVGDSSFAGVELAPPKLNAKAPNSVLVAYGGVKPGKVKTVSFVVPIMDGLSAMLVGHGVRWSFDLPNGRRIEPGTTKNDSNYVYDKIKDVATFQLRNPMRGKWTVTVRSERLDSTAAYLTALQVEGNAPEVAHCETMVRGAVPKRRSAANPGEIVFVRTFITDTGKIVRGTQWEVRAKTPSGGEFVLPVYDDGRHADGQPVDGIHVGAFAADTMPGFYSFRADGHAPDGVSLVVTGAVEVRRLSNGTAR